MAKIFLHMLFADQAHRGVTAVTVPKGYAKQGFLAEDAFSMVAELCMFN